MKPWARRNSQLLILLFTALFGLATLNKLVTTNTKMSKRALVVIAAKGFQDHEFSGVIQGLKHAGYHYDVCGLEKGVEAVGKFGSKQLTAVAMRDASPENYDRIAFIGGPGARALADEPDALDLAKRFYEAKKVVGAICIAPTILANAGLLKGRKATVWDSNSGTGPEAHFLSDHGAKFVPHTPVVIDAPFITGNGPDAAEEFGKTFASM
jgi:protease I